MSSDPPPSPLPIPPPIRAPIRTPPISSPTSPSSPSPSPPSHLQSLLSPFKGRPRPSTSLPTLRIMLHPKPGLGMDARLPLANLFRCFLSLESYFSGGSNVRFGIESNHIPYLRLEVAPSTTLSLRPSPMRFSDLKFGVIGASFTFFNAGAKPDFRLSSLSQFWTGISPFLSPVVELQHRNTVLGSFIDDRQRKTFNDTIAKLRIGKESLPEYIRQGRKLILKGFKQDGMPPIDPREKVDANSIMKARLQKQIDRLKDPSSLYQGSRPYWPGVSRFDEKNSAKSPNETVRPPPTGKLPISVVGRMQKEKDGTFKLADPDTVSDDPYGEERVFDVKQDYFSSLRLYLQSIFKRFKR